MIDTNSMSSFAKNIMHLKYAHDKPDGTKESWDEIAHRVVTAVMQEPLDKGYVLQHQVDRLVEIVRQRKFIPGGRYLYASGRPYHQVNNCLLLRAEDSREGWADLVQKATLSLMTGAGIGVVYSDLREEGAPIHKTGGTSSGPLSLMKMINEVGRNVMQGGSRRCLPKGTKVLMADLTTKNIEDIVPGDLVTTRYGVRKVTGRIDQGEQEILEIVTDRGTVRSSRNHRWLAAGGPRTKTFKITAENLDLNSKLYRYYSPKKLGGDELPTNIAYLIGYYLGDGCAYSSNRTHEVTLQVGYPKHNSEQVDYLLMAMKEYLGVDGHVRRGHGDVTEIRFRSKDLVEHFQQFKKPNTPFHIPSIIQEADLEARYAFLAGWFDADGYYGKDSWKLCNAHPSVRQEIIEFLDDMGFTATENNIEVRLNSYQFPAWRQHVTQKYSFKRPKGRLFERSTSEVPSKITSIRSVGVEPTYDIEVEGEHEFVADGFVSHNSAIWAGLHWNHPDVFKFIYAKDWSDDVKALKEKDFNFPGTLDMTNISVILDDAFFAAYHDNDNEDHRLAHQVYSEVVSQMVRTAEPGFSIDIGENAGENNRNACTELTSRDDSDVCNIGSIVISRIESVEEMAEVTELGTMFLLAGTLYSHLPYDKVHEMREKNRRLGLGLMGLHEWCLNHGQGYEVSDELREYLAEYAASTEYAHRFADAWGISKPIKTRAVAPTGTIGIIGETTTGCEPIFCVAYKRRFLRGQQWHYQYVIDPTAKALIDKGVNPEDIEDAYVLAENVEKRLQFQADLQEYVDHGISSTINLPAWGSLHNNENTLESFKEMLIHYLPKLRGITCYPDGARGGQPLTPVSYAEAVGNTEEVFVEAMDICDLTGSGTCGS